MNRGLRPLLVLLLAVSLAACTREQTTVPTTATAPLTEPTVATEALLSSGLIVSVDPDESLARGERY